MADVQIKDVFDTVRIPLRGEELGFNSYSQAGSSMAWSQSSYAMNLIPTQFGDEKVYNKREGFPMVLGDVMNDTSLNRGLYSINNPTTGIGSIDPIATGVGVTGKYYSVIATHQPGATKISNLPGLSGPSGYAQGLFDCVMAVIGWHTTLGYRVYILSLYQGKPKVLFHFAPPLNTSISDIKLDFSDAIIGNVNYLLINCYNPTLMGGGNSGTSVAWWIQYNYAAGANFWDNSVLNTTYGQITDVDYPGNVAKTGVIGPLIQSGSFILALTREGFIYNSDLNSITAWSANSYIYAFPQPDLGIKLERYKNHVLAFGQRQIAFFNNVGQATSTTTPMQMMESATIKMGACSPKSILNLNDTIHWVAQDQYGPAGYYKLNQYQIEKLSTPQEDVIFRSQSYETLGIRTSFIKLNNTRVILFGIYPYLNERAPQPMLLTQATFTDDTSISTELRTGFLAYSLDANEFFVFSYGSAWSTSYFPLPLYNNVVGGINFQGICLEAIYTTPPDLDVCALSHIYFTQSYSPAYSDCKIAGTRTDLYTGYTISNYSSGIQTSLHMFGTEKRKRIHKLKIIGNHWKDSADGWLIWFVWHKADANISSGGGSFPIYSRSISGTDITNTRMYINNVGMSRMWTFAIAERGAGPFSIKALEADISICQS